MSTQPPLPIMTNLYGQLQKKYSIIKAHHPHCYLLMGFWAKSNEEKAEAFASHLSHIYTLHPDINDPAHSSSIIENLSSPLPMLLPSKAFNLSDITLIIKTVKK